MKFLIPVLTVCSWTQCSWWCERSVGWAVHSRDSPDRRGTRTLAGPACCGGQGCRALRALGGTAAKGLTDTVQTVTHSQAVHFFIPNMMIAYMLLCNFV